MLKTLHFNPNKSLSFAIIAVLVLSSFLIFAVPQVKATTLFSDSFESNDFSAWANNPLGTATIQISTAHANSGTHSAQITINSASSGASYGAYLQEPLNPVTVLYARQYVYFTSFGNLASGHRGLVADFYGIEAICFRNSGGTFYWGTDDSGYTSNQSIPLNQWISLETMYNCTSNTISLWINGVLTINNFATGFTATSINSWVTGEPYTDVNENGATWFTDDVVLSSSYVGTMVPTSSNIVVSSSLAGNSTIFSCDWTDNVNLAGYIFGTNNTGSWVNSTWASLSGTSAWANVTKTLNAVIGNKVAYEWWANDTNGVWGNTGLQIVLVNGGSISVSGYENWMIVQDAYIQGYLDSTLYTHANIDTLINRCIASHVTSIIAYLGNWDPAKNTVTDGLGNDGFVRDNATYQYLITQAHAHNINVTAWIEDSALLGEPNIDISWTVYKTAFGSVTSLGFDGITLDFENWEGKLNSPSNETLWQKYISFMDGNNANSLTTYLRSLGKLSTFYLAGYDNVNSEFQQIHSDGIFVMTYDVNGGMFDMNPFEGQPTQSIWNVIFSGSQSKIFLVTDVIYNPTDPHNYNSANANPAQFQMNNLDGFLANSTHSGFAGSAIYFYEHLYGGSFSGDYSPQSTTDWSSVYYWFSSGYTTTVAGSFSITVTSADGNPTASGLATQGGNFATSVTSPFAGSTGTQYVCTGYSIDGGSNTAGTSYTFTNIQANHTITYNWKTQYYLTVSSSHGTPSGAGWYDANTYANGALNSGTVSGSVGTQYVFASWDLGGTNYAQSNNINMTSAKTVTAAWTTQYYLTVTSTYGNQQGIGWYNSSATATFSVTTPFSGGTGVQRLFTSWSGSGVGSYSGSASSYSVTMNNAITETGTWQTQYLLTPSNDTHSAITPTVATWINSGASQSFNYSATLSYSITGVYVDGSSVTNTGTYTFFNVQIPHTIQVFSANIIPPTFSSIIASSTLINTPSSFTVTVNDPVVLQPKGQYQFGTNNTGQWVWQNKVNFTSTPQTVSVTITLNDTVNEVIACQYNFTDDAGNSDSTSIQILTTANVQPTATPSPTPAPGDTTPPAPTPPVIEHMFLISLAGLGMFAVVPIISVAGLIISVVYMTKDGEEIDPRIITAGIVLVIAVNIISIVGILIINGVHTAMPVTQFLLWFSNIL